jgi:hypothetical protein
VPDLQRLALGAGLLRKRPFLPYDLRPGLPARTVNLTIASAQWQCTLLAQPRGAETVRRHFEVSIFAVLPAALEDGDALLMALMRLPAIATNFWACPRASPIADCSRGRTAGTAGGFVKQLHEGRCATTISRASAATQNEYGFNSEYKQLP